MAIPNTNVGTKEIQLKQVSLCLGKKLFFNWLLHQKWRPPLWISGQLKTNIL